MIKLDENKILPDGLHDIVGKMQEIITDKSLEEVCKEIVKNEFMDAVDDWGCDFEDVLDESVGMGTTYAEVLSNADWNCTKYYVHFDENDNARLFKILEIEENSNDDIFEIKDNNDGTLDFHIRFTSDEDNLCCVSGAIDMCSLKKGEVND